MHMPLSPSARRIERVRHELVRREVRVSRISSNSPGFLSLTFQSDSLAGFTSLSFDDHVKFIITDASGETHRRDFTPIAYNAATRELTLEFALHAHGPACDWARHAKIGDAAVIGGPKGSMIIPLDYDWHLLAGDGSAMPAMRRRLQELPAGARVTVLAAVPSVEDQVPFDTQAHVDVRWLSNAADLVQALRNVALPAGEGFAWCAGEASVMAKVREVLLTERTLPREATRISAYWKAGASDFHETL
jgi:NADPH-dependent ferric siderophore reductase